MDTIRLCFVCSLFLGTNTLLLLLLSKGQKTQTRTNERSQIVLSDLREQGEVSIGRNRFHFHGTDRLIGTYILRNWDNCGKKIVGLREVGSISCESFTFSLFAVQMFPTYAGTLNTHVVVFGSAQHVRKKQRNGQFKCS